MEVRHLELEKSIDLKIGRNKKQRLKLGIVSKKGIYRIESEYRTHYIYNIRVVSNDRDSWENEPGVGK